MNRLRTMYAPVVCAKNFERDRELGELLLQDVGKEISTTRADCDKRFGMVMLRALDGDKQEFHATS